MRIVSWNVNGLRSVLNKGAWRWIEDVQPEMILLQEIKTRQEQLTNVQSVLLDSYYKIWNPAARLGYSGVASFLSEQFGPHTFGFTHTFGLGEERFDSEGRLIITSFSNVHIFNIYFPNGRHDLSRVEYKLEFYRVLLKKCDEIHAQGGQIILSGDFNTAHRPIDLKNPKSNQNATGFLPIEREMIDLYLAHGFVDIFRFLYPEKIQYTWWSNLANSRARGTGWRLDYFLISENLVSNVIETTIFDQVQGSDHCPVLLEIKL